MRYPIFILIHKIESLFGGLGAVDPTFIFIDRIKSFLEGFRIKLFLEGFGHRIPDLHQIESFLEGDPTLICIDRIKLFLEGFRKPGLCAFLALSLSLKGFGNETPNLHAFIALTLFSENGNEIPRLQVFIALSRSLQEIQPSILLIKLSHSSKVSGARDLNFILIDRIKSSFGRFGAGDPTLNLIYRI
ncbi:uncharacterized protein G2W53_041169 [Senna tora]|uniref:Uncharacterized protein n=1 Tax=Senna tora TaxID=362788 RepID=A0A834SEE3_9FABA|nr:uncharacterized protein G2W53_041169 [Senna tora]